MTFAVPFSYCSCSYSPEQAGGRALALERGADAFPSQVGRRPVFVGSLLVFALFQIGDALAQNFATIIVIRFIAAVFASSPLTNAGGVVSLCSARPLFSSSL